MQSCSFDLFNPLQLLMSCRLAACKSLVLRRRDLSQFLVVCGQGLLLALAAEFLPRDASAERGYEIAFVCPSVSLSVCNDQVP